MVFALIWEALNIRVLYATHTMLPRILAWSWPRKCCHMEWSRDQYQYNSKNIKQPGVPPPRQRREQVLLELKEPERTVPCESPRVLVYERCVALERNQAKNVMYKNKRLDVPHPAKGNTPTSSFQDRRLASFCCVPYFYAFCFASHKIKARQ